MNLYVIETEDNAFLGTIQWAAEELTIKTGLRGHPVRVSTDDVVSIMLASEHPLVEV